MKFYFTRLKRQAQWGVRIIAQLSRPEKLRRNRVWGVILVESGNEKGVFAVAETRSNGNKQPDLTPSLIIQLRKGHDGSGKLLDSLYRVRLIRFSLGYLGNKEEAEDVVQDVFFRVINSSVVPDNVRAWIYEICRNRCIDRLRAKNRRLDDQTLPTTSYFAEQLTGNLTRILKGEQRLHLWQRLATLPTEQREVLLMRYTEGLSRAEIAEVLKIPENLVKHRIYNGLEKLRKHESLADDL